TRRVVARSGHWDCELVVRRASVLRIEKHETATRRDVHDANVVPRAGIWRVWRSALRWRNPGVRRDVEHTYTVEVRVAGDNDAKIGTYLRPAQIHVDASIVVCGADALARTSHRNLLPPYAERAASAVHRDDLLVDGIEEPSAEPVRIGVLITRPPKRPRADVGVGPCERRRACTETLAVEAQDIVGVTAIVRGDRRLHRKPDTRRRDAGA